MSVRYIGSKARVIHALAVEIGRPGQDKRVFVDSFCGTGVVAEAAARAGWSIRLNDHLMSAVTMAHARLVSQKDAEFGQFGGYAKVVDQLMDVEPIHGFIWREYSPASEKLSGIARMYFTEANAAKIDAIRKQVSVWRTAGQISLAEERLLIADLLLATNAVANIAGTYGCFLSHWSVQAQQALALKARELFPRHVEVSTSVLDVRDVETAPDDLVYLDPPYTKRQYAAYYHVLETITVGDEPIVGGVTGLRPWHEKASDFCYRSRALHALIQLVAMQNANRVLLSYSDEGHVPLAPLAEQLSSLGRLSVLPLKEIGRYRPNRAASKAGSSVTEYLLIFERNSNVASEDGNP